MMKTTLPHSPRQENQSSHGRLKRDGHTSYPVPIWNGIFEHYDRIADAIWEFLWCIDKITREEDGVGIVLGGMPVKFERIADELKGSHKETVRRHFKRLEAEKYIRTRRTPYGHVIEVLNSKKFDIWKRKGGKEKPQNEVSHDQEKPQNEVSLPPRETSKCGIRNDEKRFQEPQNEVSETSKCGFYIDSAVDSAVDTTEDTTKPPLPACAVDLRQDHASAAVAESENRRNGGPSIFPLAVIPDQNPLPRGAPPVLAFLAKHGRLPDYVVDESHLILDAEGNYAGYIGRNGKRYTEWNEFESIEMASRRQTDEAIRKFRMATERRLHEKETAESETPIVPRKATKEEKLEMLKTGAADAEQAEVWSKQSGFPADVLLIRNGHEREAAYGHL
jgi:hypothetical protein